MRASALALVLALGCDGPGSGVPRDGDVELDTGPRRDTGAAPDAGPLDGGAMPAFVEVPLPPLPLVRATMAGGAGSVVSGGLAAFDADGDDIPDLAVANHEGELIFLRGAPRLGFTDATAAAGLAGLTRTIALSIADVEGDGDTDLFVGGSDGARLLLNGGAGTFTDGTAAWGLDVDGPVAGAAFADFDADGDLDLYVLRYDFWVDGEWPAGLPNVLYRNAGGVYREVTRSPGGVSAPGASLAATWSDVDGNGRPDLLVINDFGPHAQGNQLFLNHGPDAGDPEGWVFDDIAPALGFDLHLFGMGVALGDVDGDLDLDAYVSNLGQNALLMSDPRGYVDRADDYRAAAGFFDDPDPPQSEPPRFQPWLEDPEMARYVTEYCADPDAWVLTSWAAIFFDANQDARLDLFVATGVVGTGFFPEGPGQPSLLFLQARDERSIERFVRMPEPLFPTPRGSARGALAVDLDRDGDLDLAYVQNGFDQEPALRIVENRLARAHWIEIVLEHPSANRDALGARVEIFAGDRWQLREIGADRPYASAAEPRAHFGLGGATIVDQIRVTWPDGTITALGREPADRVLIIRP